jgi:hypothetical protein
MSTKPMASANPKRKPVHHKNTDVVDNTERKRKAVVTEETVTVESTKCDKRKVATCATDKGVAVLAEQVTHDDESEVESVNAEDTKLEELIDKLLTKREQRQQQLTQKELQQQPPHMLMSADSTAQPAALPAVAAAKNTIPVFKTYATKGRLTALGTVLIDGKPTAYTLNNTAVAFLTNHLGRVFLRIIDSFGLKIDKLPVTVDTDPVLADSAASSALMVNGIIAVDKCEPLDAGNMYRTAKFIAIGNAETGIITINCEQELGFHLTITPTTSCRARICSS